jgi:phosphatidylglycerophosphate synthase
VPQSPPRYQPRSRRPIAAVFRRLARGASDFCVRRGVHPDAISYLSIVASLAAGACFWQSGRWPALLLVAPLLCYVRLLLNMLDGMVALGSGKASPRGEILNDLPDRLSDVLIFAGVAHSGLCSPFPAYWAAILALLTAYVGTLGQAVGARREFGGVMSKPWRMVALHAGGWLTLALLWRPTAAGGAGGDAIRFGPLTVLDWTCVLVIAGCVQTIWVRLARTMRVLRGSEQNNG